MRLPQRTDRRRKLVGAVVVLAASLPLLVAGPSMASSGDTTPTGSTISPSSQPPPRLPGLRSLFALVRLDIESLLGGAGPVELVLGSAAERDSVLQATQAERRDQVAVAHALAVGRWAEFERVVTAVLGARSGSRFPYPQMLAAFTMEVPSPVTAESAALIRDRLVQRMAVLGYPAHLIADVVGGRIPIEALEHAVRLRLLGRAETEITRYLEAQAEAQARAHVAAKMAAPPSPSAPLVLVLAPMTPARVTDRIPDLSAAARMMVGRREQFGPAVLRSAARHRVDPDLVRAVIRHESDWNPNARSPKGALGLMQLMPGTARLLGVDPLDPEQNIDGGTRYLASLLVLFDSNLDAAIMGYIGGPGYARTWLRGELVPSSEVRTYVQNVKTSYLSPPPRDRVPPREGGNRRATLDTSP